MPHARRKGKAPAVATDNDRTLRSLRWARNLYGNTVAERRQVRYDFFNGGSKTPTKRKTLSKEKRSDQKGHCNENQEEGKTHIEQRNAQTASIGDKLPRIEVGASASSCSPTAKGQSSRDPARYQGKQRRKRPRSKARQDDSPRLNLTQDFQSSQPQATASSKILFSEFELNFSDSPMILNLVSD